MAALGVGSDPYYVGVPLMLIIGFYLSTWETFHTGCLTLGYVNGPTEGVVICCLVFLITAFKGLIPLFTYRNFILGATCSRSCQPSLHVLRSKPVYVLILSNTELVSQKHLYEMAYGLIF